ncbi:MAG: VOC family protein [Patescibacteria group bacterium]
MIRGIEGINLFSQNATKLANFYKKVVGLKLSNEAVMGKDTNVYEFGFKRGTSLYVIDHSEVKGKTNEPKRIMFDLEVDDIKKEVARLKKNKVKLVQDTYHVEMYGWIATFVDIDGNYFQLVQVKAK